MILGVNTENYDCFDEAYKIEAGSTQIKDEKIIFDYKHYSSYKYNSRGPGKIAEAILEYYPYGKEVAPYEKIVFSLKDVKIKEVKHSVKIHQHKEVGKDDIECLMKEMLERNKNEVYEHEIIQILPFDFRVDDSKELKDPLGKKGTTLEVSANIIYADKDELAFMRKIIKKLGTKVKSYNFVYRKYAEMIAKLEADKLEIYSEGNGRISSSSYYFDKLLFGLCLYGRGYNALYEVDSNGDVLLKGF